MYIRSCSYLATRKDKIDCLKTYNAVWYNYLLLIINNRLGTSCICIFQTILSESDSTQKSIHNTYYVKLKIVCCIVLHISQDLSDFAHLQI
jgi:hypothetical protein